ncbi:MAG TPA: HAMP domain-containing histidine kinase [Acholeplasmataceae bacterium]|nr:HAMP domain-containing histidine kinase [Acholeplasmataceae bacterium]
MKRWKLLTQISVIFTIVTVMISLVFVLIFEFGFQRIYSKEIIYELTIYSQDVVNKFKENQHFRTDDYIGITIHKWKQDPDTGEYKIDVNPYYSTPIVDDFFRNVDLKDYIQELVLEENNETFETQRKIGNKTYNVRGVKHNPETENGFYVLAFTDDRYVKAQNEEFTQTLRFTTLALIVLGNISLLLWSRLVVGRINYLEEEVSLLVKTNYERPIDTSGRDEISSLAKSVEKMRLEILEHEQTKREIMQNISHDFKTPISVIKTYGEAIKDGITDASEIDVIIKQADTLNHKVVQLLQLNKINYLTNDQVPEEIFVKEIIKNIINKNKYKFDKEFVTDLDNSTYLATPDSLEIAIGNIIDNAMRYAKTKIVIVLKNKKLTIYNDGEQINEDFIEKIFKPYEKGHKGEFGLGMSIAQQTLAFFNLSISVKNVRKGVMFVIEPI